MSDDELWSRLRADIATADVDADAAAAITRHAHARLAAPPPTVRQSLRAVESLAVVGIAVAQIAWAWSVVLR